MKNYLERLRRSDLGLGFWKSHTNSSVNSPESGWMEKKRRGIGFSLWLIIALPLVTFFSLGIYCIIAGECFYAYAGYVGLSTTPSPTKPLGWPSCPLLGGPRDLLDDVVPGIPPRPSEPIKPLTQLRVFREIFIDVKILKTVFEKQINAETNTTETSWWQTPKTLLRSSTNHSVTPLESTNLLEETTQEEDPNLIVRFDYIDLSSEDIPMDGHFIDSVLMPSNNSRETIIILKNDDNGKKIFLKTSANLPGLTPEEEEEVKTIKSETTTPKAFVYSPTIPQATTKKLKVDVTTRKYNQTEDTGCYSTKLPFCEGILPYDVVQLPNLPGIKRFSDLTAFIPYFQMIIDSGCSRRAREFICSVLEPECQPEGLKQRLPCKLNCKDDCKDYILETLPLSKAFDCQKYPDWNEKQNCLNMFKGNCNEDEFKCSDGTCIPSKWVCDGVHDCPGSRPGFDENNCQKCSQNEFRCVMDGKCVPLHWKCDGQIDCADHSDEMSCSSTTR